MKKKIIFLIILVCLSLGKKLLSQQKEDNYFSYLGSLCDKSVTGRAKININEPHRAYIRTEDKNKITQKMSIYGLSIVYNLHKNNSYMSEFVINGKSMTIKGDGNLSGEISENSIFTFSTKDYFYIDFYLYSKDCNGKYCRLSLHYILKISKKSDKNIEIFSIFGGFEEKNLYPVDIKNFVFLYLEDIRVNEIYSLAKKNYLDKEIIKDISENKNYYLVTIKKLEKNNGFDFVIDPKTKEKYFILIEVDMFFMPQTYKIIYKNWIN